MPKPESILIGTAEAVIVNLVHRAQGCEAFVTFYVTEPQERYNQYLSLQMAHDERLERGKRFRLVLEPID